MPARSTAPRPAPSAASAPRRVRRSRGAARLPLPSALFAAVLLLQACGGSDGDAPAPQPVAIAGLVVDGPLQGARVCYDLDDNGACDTGEPDATTDADGRYSLAVLPADAGRHAVVAEVPATAIDKDTGAAIGAALVLVAPATGSADAQSVFVSPLTTVVAHTAADTGSSVADAAARVQAQLGLTASPLADFTAAGAAPALGLAARAVGRVMVDTAKLAAANGVAAAPAARLVREAASSQLPVLATALEGAASAPPAEAIALAAAAVATQLNLTPGTVQAVAAAVTQPTVAGDAAGPFVSVRRFTYTDAGNYSYQLFSGDSSQTDAAGVFTAHELRASLAGGVAVPFSRNQLYWTGSTWNDCGDSGHAAVTTSIETATRPQLSRYCGGLKTEGRSTWEDIGGQTLRAVLARMRAYPLRDTVGSTTDATGLPVKWGADPALVPADATFPAGARYVTRKTTSDLGNTDRIETAVRPTIRHEDGVFRQATALERLSLMGGNLAAADTVVTNQNSLFVEDETLASQSDATLQALKRWRLAVDVAGLKGRFFRCDVTTAGNSQACEARGDATLALQTQGGIRLLRVASGYPAALKDLFQRQRFWAEHVGTVFRGTTDLERSYNEQRLNKPAWDALRTALGIPEPVLPTAEPTTGPFRILRNFSFTDARTYSWRLFTGDDSVVNAAGEFVVNETRRQLQAGAEVPFLRNRLFWTGSTWLDCPAEGPLIMVQAAAPKHSVFCQTYVDEEIGNLRISLAGRLMSDVVNEIRSYASTDAGGVGWGGWGIAPSRVPALSTTRFPAGSELSIRGGRPVDVPEAIATAESDRVRIPTSGTPFAQWPLARTLDALIAACPGSLLGATPNGSNTLVFRILDEAPTNPLYSRTVDYRVAFDPSGQRVRFSRNNRLASNDATANHEVLLDSTYTIEQLGDARIMKFAALPADFENRFGYSFRLAERGGQVWYALKDHRPADQLAWTQRLNGTAWDALRTALGIQ